MGRASTIQNSFNAGELSSLMLGRQDVDKYASGLFVCLNAIVLAQGAWTRRPGTAFLHQAKYHDKISRVIPFQYSITQTYILEFGYQYIRFFSNHGILTEAAQTIAGISKANPAVLTYLGGDNFTNGDRVHVSGAVGMTQVNSREFVVTNVNAGAKTFQLYNSDGTAVNSTAYGAWSSAGTVAEILEVTTAFVESDIPDIRVTQSADTLYILHPNYPTQTLVRVSALSWTLANVVFTDGPYDSTNITGTTLTPSALSGSITLTASAITGINNNTGFQTTDVGRLVRFKNTTWGYAQITAYSSTTVVTATVLASPSGGGGGAVATVDWRLGVWSDTTGYPACGTFYEDRLFLAGAPLFPQRMDGSKSGLYTNFSPTATDGTVADNNAVGFALNSDDVNQIKWIVSSDKGLLAGTSRGEWWVRASTLGVALTPTNIQGKPSTRYGSAAVAPLVAGRAILFVQRAARKLREFVYEYTIDGFKAPDMTLLSEHITRPSINEVTLQQQPQIIMWAVRGDGALLGFTYERDQNVVGWHRHELGGQSDAAGLSIPVVESVAVVPAPDSTRDELYVVVQRYVNGAIKRYVEYMSKIWDTSDEQEDAFYVDCGWTDTTPNTSVVTGLWHLEGETVGVYIDGTKHINVTVTNGTATLTRAGSMKTLGYFYNSDGQTMPVEGGAQDGSSQGKTKRISRVGFWLLDTLGLKFGTDATHLTEILERKWGAPYGTATPLFTGVARERLEGDYDKLGQVYWRADGPFPATLLAEMPQFTVSDDS